MGITRLIAGALAVAISAGLSIVVLYRDVDLNVVNAWTIVLGAVGGALLIVAGALGLDRPVVAATLTLLAGGAPAMIGGFGFLYLIPVLVVMAGERRALTRR